MDNSPMDSVSKLDSKQVRSLLSFGLQKPDSNETADESEAGKTEQPAADTIEQTLRFYPKNKPR